MLTPVYEKKLHSLIGLSQKQTVALTITLRRVLIRAVDKQGGTLTDVTPQLFSSRKFT